MCKEEGVGVRLIEKEEAPSPPADFFGQGGTSLCRSRAIHVVIVGSPQETGVGFME
jgi:hypothetical protein